MLTPKPYFWYLAALLAVGTQHSSGLAEPANPTGTPCTVSSTDVTKAGMDPEQLARIPARMKEFVDQGAIPGTVTLVARHGVVVSLEAVGYQDLENKKPMRTDTIVQIRDMTKSLT